MHSGMRGAERAFAEPMSTNEQFGHGSGMGFTTRSNASYATRLALALGTTRWSLVSRRTGLISSSSSSSSTGPSANICGAPAGIRV